jgi:Rieske Fe-S protein
MEKKNRRTFLKVITVGIASFFVFIWNKFTLNQVDIIQQKERILPFNKNKQVSFFENFIIVNQNEKTTVLSSHCTHLGCKINRMENGRLACPCHGSEYDLEGKVLKGPAYKSLQILPSKLSSDGTHIEIEI